MAVLALAPPRTTAGPRSRIDRDDVIAVDVPVRHRFHPTLQTITQVKPGLVVKNWSRFCHVSGKPVTFRWWSQY